MFRQQLCNGLAHISASNFGIWLSDTAIKKTFFWIYDNRSVANYVIMSTLVKLSNLKMKEGAIKL